MTKRVTALSLAGLMAVLLSTGCLTLTLGTHQTVPALSRPPGVRVFVDGEFAGTTPVNLDLPRKRVHAIRFEMDGYRPVEITLQRKYYNFLAALVGDIALIPVGAIAIGLPLHALFPSDQEDDFAGLGWAILGGLAAWIGGVFVDVGLPSNRELEPRTLSITMEKGDSTGTPIVMEMDAERLRDLRWISVAVK